MSCKVMTQSKQLGDPKVGHHPPVEKRRFKLPANLEFLLLKHVLSVLFTQLHNFGGLLKAKKLKAAEQKQVKLRRFCYCVNIENKGLS